MDRVERVEKVERVKGVHLGHPHHPSFKVTTDSPRQRPRGEGDSNQAPESHLHPKLAQPLSNIRVVEVEGISSDSWEEAARHALEAAAAHFPSIFELEVIRQTAVIEHGKIQQYQAAVKIRYCDEHWSVSEFLPNRPRIGKGSASRGESTQLENVPTVGLEPHQEVVKHYQEIQHLGEDELP